MHHPVDASDLDAALDLAAMALRKADRVAVLTGAGVSAESGVATFRGADGLWEGHHVEDVATPGGFAQPVSGVALLQPAPRQSGEGPAERRPPRPRSPGGALGPDRFTLITQNIDGLHQAAGSRHVLELHGRLSRVRCTACDYLADRPGESLPDLPRCPTCGELLRPDVVWFEEMLPHGTWREAREQVEACQCLLVVGTSAVVFPAAGLIGMARDAGACVLEFNLEPTLASSSADLCLHGPAGQLLPEVVLRLSGP